MKTEELNQIKEWFNAYVQSFAYAQGDWHPSYRIKIEHSRRVALESRNLARDLDWVSADGNMAEAVGWLHDVGRFSQFKEFGTFLDAESVNHGERGWSVVTKSDVLSGLARHERACILDAIRYHNVKAPLPDQLEGDTFAWVKLIRDADKLDIFYTVHAAVIRDGFQDLSRMLPQVSLDGPISRKVISELLQYRSCSIADVRSLADFLLLQLSWVYDINYAPTFRQLAQRKIVSNIVEKLPRDHDAINDLVQDIERFMANHI
jgi:hypothetical protein